MTTPATMLDIRAIKSMTLPQVLTVSLGTIPSIVAARTEAKKREVLGREEGLPIQTLRAIDIDIFHSINVVRQKLSKDELDGSKRFIEETKNLFSLNPSEIIRLKAPEGEDLVRGVENGEYNFLKDFVDSEILPLLSGGNQAGARAWRKLGEIIVRWNIKGIKEALRSALLQVKDNQSVRETLTLGFSHVATELPIKVFIIFSTCGGSGAGAFVHIAYLLRRLAEEEKIKLHLVNIQLLPGFIEQVDPEESKSSSYAVLKEMDAMMSKEFTFEAQYGLSEKDKLSYKGKIADEVYLFECSSGESALNDTGSFLGMLSDFLICQQLDPIVNVHSSMFNNIEHKTWEIPYTQYDYHGKVPYVSRGGVSKFLFPKESLLNYCRIRTARETLALSLNGNGTSIDVWNKEEQFLIKGKLKASSIADDVSFIQNPDGNTVPMTSIIQEYFHIDRDLKKNPEEYIANRKRDFEANEMPLWCSEGGVLDENAEQHFQMAEDEFSKFISELDYPRYGYRYLMHFFEGLRELIEEEIESVQEELNQFEQARGSVPDEVTARLTEVEDFRQQGWIKRQRRRRELPFLLRKFSDVCKDALLIEIGYQIRERVIEILQRFRVKLDREISDLSGLADEMVGCISDLKLHEKMLVEFDYASLVPNGRVLLDLDDFDFYYQNFHNKADQLDNRSLSEVVLNELKEKKGSLRQHSGKIKEEITPILFKLASECFKSLEMLNIEEVLERKYIEEDLTGKDSSALKIQLKRRIEESKGFLKLETNNPAREGQKLAIRCVSVKRGENSKLAKIWLPKVVDLRSWHVLENFNDNEIVFYQTEYAFPIYAVTLVRELKRAYDNTKRKKRENIFHLYPHYADFPELIPFNPKQALETLFKAVSIGLVQNRNGTWFYQKDGSVIPLGRKRREILDYLSSNQAPLTEMEKKFEIYLRQVGTKTVVNKLREFTRKQRKGTDDFNDLTKQELIEKIILDISFQEE